MSITSVGLRSSASGVRQELLGRWTGATAAARTRVQVATFLVAVLIAYHYSLRTLASNLNANTPLAYVGLVPFIALGVAVGRRNPRRPEPSINDRQLDYIVGVPLLLAALFANLLLPHKMSTVFWIWRMDIVTLPLFVAGAVALVFGTRVLWRQKVAVLYLLLAWPLPYTMLLVRFLNDFTNLTLSGVRTVALHAHLATIPSTSDGSVFQVVHAGKPFQLSVVSACSGVDGVVGFLLVGVAFAVLVEGPRLRKAVWMLVGVCLLWVINIGRIVLIFWAGRQWGEHVAINVLHPFVGLVTFSLGVLLMMFLLRPFRLSIGTSPPTPQGPERVAKVPVNVPSIYPAVAILAIVAMVLGVSNQHLKSYDLVANSAGEPKLASYSLYPASPQGWKVSYDTRYTWAAPYFGENSTWLRFVYFNSGVGGTVSSNLPVTADVIDSTSLSSFSDYGVQACYQFHGYSLRNVSDVSLGGGIQGQTISYSAGANGNWSIVWWIWPVKSSGATHYERVILYVQDSSSTEVKVSKPVSGFQTVQGHLDSGNAADQRLLAERAFLTEFAREVVQNQALVKPGSELSTVAAVLGTVGNTTVGGVPVNIVHVAAPSAALPSAVSPADRARREQFEQRLHSHTGGPYAGAIPPGAQPTTTTTAESKH